MARQANYNYPLLRARSDEALRIEQRVAEIDAVLDSMIARRRLERLRGRAPVPRPPTRVAGRAAARHPPLPALRRDDPERGELLRHVRRHGDGVTHTEPPPALDAPGAAEPRCPACLSLHRPGQTYCLECGDRLARRARACRRRPPRAARA